MNRLSVLFAFFLLCSGMVNAQNSRTLIVKQGHDNHQLSTNQQPNDRVVRLSPTTTNLIKFRSASETTSFQLTDFPVSTTQNATINVIPVHSIIDNTTEYYVGQSTRMKLPTLTRFSGTIMGEANSEVFMTVIDDVMYCRIKHNNEEFTITPTLGQFQEYTVTNVRNSVKDAPLACGAVEPLDIQKYMASLKSEKTLSNTILQVDIALDVCKEWYLWKFNGDTTRIRDYILSAYSMVSFIYEKEMNITVHVPWMYIRTTSDPYNSGGTSSDWGGMPGTVLAAMPAYWKKNNLNVKANLVHAISVGGRGGVGNYDGMATGIHDGNTWGPFAAISLSGDTKYPLQGSSFLNFDFDVHTIAHEMGHNFNCPHTHSCSWNPAIDTCVIYENNNDGCPTAGNKRICTQYTQTSIMSYCREINNWVSKMTFLAKPASLIRTYAEKHLKEVNVEVSKPTAPSLLLPPNNEQAVIFSPGFKWLKNDITLNYHFQISTSNQFDVVLIDTVVAFDTISITGLTESKDYFWRVASVNNSGEGLFSEIRRFTTGKATDFMQPLANTSLSDDKLDFGDVPLKSSKELNFKIFAGNAVGLPLDSVVFFGNAGRFAISKISRILPASLTSTDTVIATISFTPTLADVNASTSIRICYHDKENKVQSTMIDISGNAVQPVQPTASTNLSDDVLDFGKVQLNTTKELNFKVFTGNSVDLPLDSVVFFGEAQSFTIKKISKVLPLVLKKADSVTVTVSFTPTIQDVSATSTIAIYFHDLDNQVQLISIDLKGSVNPTGISDNEVNSIPEITLEIVPNPVSNNGAIGYTLPQRHEARLSIYNMLGQEVSVLFSGVSESVFNTAKFSNSLLHDGIYQAVLRVGSVMKAVPLYIIK